MIDRFFRLREHQTSIAVEVRAVAATFLTMAYILFVNPQILSQAGMPADDDVVATALASAIACLVMGLYARYPFALAPGMGLNAYFTFGVVIGLGIHWRVFWRRCWLCSRPSSIRAEEVRLRRVGESVCVMGAGRFESTGEAARALLDCRVQPTSSLIGMVGGSVL